MLKPPPGPWVKGQHEEYSAFVIEVTICQNNFNQVFSTHKLQEEVDAEITKAMPSMGMEQAAFGLLTEAIRREVLLQALIHVSQDQQMVERYLGGTEEEQKGIEEVLGAKATQIIQENVSRMMPQIAKEIMAWVQNPLKKPPLVV